MAYLELANPHWLQKLVLERCNNMFNKKKTKGKEKMNKEIVKKEEKSQLAIKAEVDAWGLTDAVPKEAIEIPRLTLCQGLSDAVSAGEASMGHIIDSMTLEKLGSAVEKEYAPVEVIPLTFNMSWRHMRFYEGEKGKSGKYKFDHSEPFTPENSGLKWEEEVVDPDTGETVKWRHDQCLNFFVLVKSKLQDPLATPYMLTFSRTSFKAGRKLSSHFAKCQRAASLGRIIPPPALTFKFCGVLNKTDDHAYYVATVTPGEKTSEEALKIAKSWIPQVSSSNVKVDEEEFYRGDKAKEAGSDNVPF